MARSRGSGSAAGLARIRQGRSGSTVRTVRPAAGMERRLDARDEGGRLGAGTASGCPEQGPTCATRSRGDEGQAPHLEGNVCGDDPGDAVFGR